MVIQTGEPDFQSEASSIKDGLGGDKTYGFLGSSGYGTNAIQAGSLGLGTGSTGWAIYAKPFAGSPMITAIYALGSIGNTIISGIPSVMGSIAGPGSAFLIGEEPSLVVHWMAFGTY